MGVTPDATDQELKKAYHLLAKKLHPDSTKSCKTPGNRDKFKAAKEAYDTLRNKELRRNYDKYVMKNPSRFSTVKAGSHITKAKAHYKFGRHHYGGKRYHDAVREFQIALTLVKDNALYNSWLGLSFSHIKGQLQNARRSCEKAIELSPYEPDYHINLAIVFREAGSSAMAERSIRQALKIDPYCKRAKSWLYEIDTRPSVRDRLKKIARRFKK